MRPVLLLVASLTTACVSAPAHRPVEKTPPPRSAPDGVYKSGGTAFGGGIGPLGPSPSVMAGLIVGLFALGVYALASSDPVDEVPDTNPGDADINVCHRGPVSCLTHGR